MIDEETKPITSIACIRLGKAVKKITKAWERYTITKRVNCMADADIYNVIDTTCYVYCIDVNELCAMCKDIAEIIEKAKEGENGK